MAHLDPELLSAYIDHELPAADMAAVERHLAECDICRAEYEELRGLSTLVRELPVYAPKREIDVSADPRGGSDTLAKIIAFSKPLAIAAVVLLIAFAGLQLLTGDNDTGDDGDQISFSAVQPTEVGTETEGETSEDQAGGAPPAAAPSDSEAPAGAAFEEAPAALATEPASLGAMPAMRSESSPATPAVAPGAAIETAEPEATIAPTAEPAPADNGGGESWLPVAIVAAIVVALAGVAGWYRFVRQPARRRT